MKRFLAMALGCGVAFTGTALFAADPPELVSTVKAARSAGLNKSTLNIFLSQANGARFPLKTTQKILGYAIETQKAGAPGDQVLVKASEGVAKRVSPGQIHKTVRKYGGELRVIAESLPKKMGADARRRAVMKKYQELHPPRPVGKGKP